MAQTVPLLVAIVRTDPLVTDLSEHALMAVTLDGPGSYVRIVSYF